MADTMNKQTLLKKVSDAHSQWVSVISAIPAAEMTTAGYCGIWSAKDVVAHIAWYEHEMVHLLTVMKLEGSQLWYKPLDERNQAIYREFKDVPLALILRDEAVVFEEMMTLLEKVSEEALNDYEYFPGMPPEWKPWEVIASNTYEHYEGHTQKRDS